MLRGDFITELGALVIDHRLRRIVDHLLDAQAQLYAEESIAFEPRWTSTFLLLEEKGPLGVTEIAKSLRYTHPGIIKFTNGMMEVGLVCESEDANDERRRLLQLTPRAKRLSPRLHRIWDALRKTQTDIFQQAGCDILRVLANIDRQLDSKR